MTDLDPFALADRQIALDHEATRRLPALLERKRQRLAPSPHAFLRGSAPLYYEILAARPDLASGPAGDGWLVGDMHLENVGAYRTDDDAVVFGLNDFDDATVGPLRLDVLRLSTSILLASRGLGVSGAAALSLVERAIGQYLRGRGGAAGPPTPSCVTELISHAQNRSKKELLDDRAPMDHGRRHFVRGERYLELPADLQARVPELMRAYVAALGDRAPGRAGGWSIEDQALRIAGNGSLGVARVAVLVRDNSGDERLVELKECRDSSVNALVPAPAGKWSNEAERVVLAARALAATPPRLLAPVVSGGVPYAGRRLFPQEDKLRLERLGAGPELERLVLHVGNLLGAAHARGVASLKLPAPEAWSGEEVGKVIDGAVVLAGLLEGVSLAHSRRSGA